MDDLRIGAIVRALRQRKGWRQADLAVRATVSATLIARIERGALGSIPMGKLRRVVGALGGRLDTIVRWQGADLARLLDVRHASMHELMAGLFDSLDG
jgi:transcriptional regulator with XRE-family HTH domain